MFIIVTLPKSYDMVVTAIETLSNDKITLEFVKSRILDEQIKRLNNDFSKESSIMSNNAAFNYFQFNFNYCKLPGHKYAECRKRKADNLKKPVKWKPNKKRANYTRNNCKEDVGRNIAFNILSYHIYDNSDNKITWFLDSKATDHLINDEKYVLSSESWSNPITNGVANLFGIKTGKVAIMQKLNGKVMCCIINDVFDVFLNEVFWTLDDYTHFAMIDDLPKSKDDIFDKL